MHDATNREKAPFRYDDHIFQAEVQGGYSALYCRRRFPKQNGGGKRGECTTFTRGARLRMFRMISRINWPAAKTGLFVTLTFPDEVLPVDSWARSRALREFFRQFEAELGNPVSALWRCEWEVRQTGIHAGQVMPHYHLIVFQVRYFPYGKVNAIWRNVIHWPGYCRTDTQRLANEKAHGSYIAKYCAKVPRDGSLVSVTYSRIDGKHWGYHHKKLLPMAMREFFDWVPEDTARKLRSIAARELPWYRQETDSGFCLLGRFGRGLSREFKKVLLDSEATVE